ncbi:LacI family DNA-binding transcriptional regulator [Bifidobacterium dentium]|uniref:LacI family DNA-binding transcriptional regulator n=1 Tax=Bifidobacterium dentium TaxID=1689 RepID=UPI002095F105|nr:LacI family DNA-binding transcriptional regulator [Bifidobacterium dentium]
MSANKAGRKASMGDVAAAAGVSKTTISRYLHGEFGYMSEQTKAKIEGVIKELGYRPNKMAQSLKATVSHMVGVSIADMGNPFSSLLIKGIQEECRARDVQLLVSDSNNQPTLERANIESLLDAQVDGLIVNTVGNNDDWLVRFHDRANRKPVVMLDRIVLPLIYDSVTNNNDAAVREMLEYLKGQGFAYVVFVMRPGEGISTRIARRQAVERYCDDLGLGGEVLVYDDGIDGLRSRIANLLELCGDRKACLFANNDESMRDILEATSAGLRRRVGVCSFADEHWAKYSGPGITCLDQEPMLMGRRAAQKLFARIYDGSEEPCSLDEVPARLCIFASTEI